MSLVRVTLCALIVTLALAARPALALLPEVGLGADWIVDDNAGSFMGTLALDGHVVPNLTIGARFGAAILSNPSRFALPVDARLRFRFRRVYVEGLIGPWLVSKGDKHLRLHAGVGGGLVLAKTVSLGVELGYLDPSSMIGARIAFGF
jgi:hypothetical protein